MNTIAPKDWGEQLAIFRHSVIGPLLSCDFDHGQLAAALRELSQKRFRLPNGIGSRTFSVPTLERWLYAFRHSGLEGLRPKTRSDAGISRGLDPKLAELLRDIRKEHPSASVRMILSTLEKDGRLEKGSVSESSLRRLYRHHNLLRTSARENSGHTTRLRWEAQRPEALWHSDVCHSIPIMIGGESKPVRIHAILDDCSRFIVAIEAFHSEREVDMISILARAIRRYGAPEVLYLDNGSTYRGEALQVACSRLGISLLHARPYDPQARGKMERFWRTLREWCLDHIGQVASLHDINIRLLSFIDQHYHVNPHAGLLGKTPEQVHITDPSQPRDSLEEKQLAQAFTVRERRRVRKDSTLQLKGKDWEVDQGYLAGQLVTIAYCLLPESPEPWLEHDGKRFVLHPVDPKANSGKKRQRRLPHCKPTRVVDFDPTKVLVDKQMRRLNALGGKGQKR